MAVITKMNPNLRASRYYRGGDGEVRRAQFVFLRLLALQTPTQSHKTNISSSLLVYEKCPRSRVDDMRSLYHVSVNTSNYNKFFRPHIPPCKKLVNACLTVDMLSLAGTLVYYVGRQIS